MHSITRLTAGYFFVLLCGTLSLAGCKSEPNEKLWPVSGTILVEGKPVPTGNITFYPDRPKGNETQHQPMAVIDAEGKFELFVPGGKKGAPAGWYRVVVYSVDDPQPMKPNKYFVHKDYADVETTPLKIEVIANPEPERYDLKLKK